MAKESGSASISLKEGTDIAKVVLMPGDPLRAKYVAEGFLEQPVLFNDVRNMLGYTGIYKGKRISVMGHGMGIPSMGIYSHELYTQFGVESIIRIGSAGALSPELHTKDVVIAMGASTNSAYVDAYGFYGHIAPLADYGMLANAVKSAGELKIPVKVGSVYSSDFFYYPDPKINEKLRDMNQLAVEMETAGLYVTAIADHKKALAILSISDHIFSHEALPAIEREQGFTDMMKIALETAWQEA